MSDRFMPEQIEAALDQARFHAQNGTAINPAALIPIVEQLRDENAQLRSRMERLVAEWMKEPSVCDKGHHCEDEPGNGCGASSCFAADLRAVIEEMP